MLFREGSVVALNAAEQHFDPRTDKRGFIVTPLDSGRVEGGCIEDDGESEAWRRGEQGRWQVIAEADSRTLVLSVTRIGW